MAKRETIILESLIVPGKQLTSAFMTGSTSKLTHTNSLSSVSFPDQHQNVVQAEKDVNEKCRNSGSSTAQRDLTVHAFKIQKLMIVLKILKF